MLFQSKTMQYVKDDDKMDNATLRKVQLIQLEMAKKVKKICDANGIQYFLDGGTLLGAVRHQGFIPWDDDLDIGMLRKDYDKFISIAQPALGDQYFLQTLDTDDHYGQPFAKIRKIGTVYREEASRGLLTHNEVYIDIFPFDYFPQDRMKLKMMRTKIKICWKAISIKAGLLPWLSSSSFSEKCLSMIRNIPAVFLSCLTREKIKHKYMAAMTAYNKLGTTDVDVESGAYAGRHLLPISCFDNMVEMLFEDEYFKCPQGYHEVLKRYYGDYMTLPPEEQRMSIHSIIEVKI